MSCLEELEAYSVLEKKELTEVNGVGYVLQHKKTKARVLVVLNDDDNKVFTIGFRTPPSDDTGVPHITEHSVLCGSKKFPLKDPFVELCKGSLNTFLNAMTYSDKTVYPVASLNKKDFHNLMHVYLDAVFYPNIYTKDEIMMQEGWHYEVDEETQELKYNGVVYNEMKGVYSSAEQQLYRIIESSLLPDTAYSFESGGDPAHITELTQEAFRDFHSRYYHPSNSYIYLYGDMDAVEELKFIDEEYLSSFDYLEIDSSIADQKAFEKPVYVKEYYSLSDADSEEDNTYLSYNVVIGKSLDKKLCLAISILEHALLVAAGAPLNKALIDAGIGKDVFSSYDDGIKQPTFSIIAKNANAEDEEQFISIINETLSKLVKEGINKKSLRASLNYFEFRHKEANFGRYPKGLMLGLDAFSTWLYDDNEALSLFSLNEVYEELKQEIETDYFEKLIETYFISNTHKVYVSLHPKKGLNEEREQKEQEKLAAYKETLSEDDFVKIAENAKHLKEYQDSPDTEEQLATIPVLEIADIDKQAKKLKNEESEIEHVKLVHHDIFTNGIAYLSLNFDLSDIDYENYPYIALICEILKDVDTEHYTYNELANEINLSTGGIGFGTLMAGNDDPDGLVSQFHVTAKMLYEQIDRGMELVEEILFTSKLSDKKRLREIVAEARANMKVDLVSSGHQTAAARAASYVSPAYVAKELTDGIGYYQFLANIDDNFDTEYETVAAKLQEILGVILRRDALIISYTGDRKPEEVLTTSVSAFSKKLSTRLAFENVKKITPVILNEGFKTASQVQYVATAGNFKRKGLEYTGALTVLTSIFSYDYLWINVRVKGGAYGCMCSFTRSGNAYFTSYRDPNLMETYEIYKKAADYVANFNANDRDMTKYIIGAISKLDAPMTPSAYGTYSFAAYMTKLTDADIQRARDEVLSANVDSIRALAPYVQAACEEGVLCAIGGESKIAAAVDEFKDVLSIF